MNTHSIKVILYNVAFTNEGLLSPTITSSEFFRSQDDPLLHLLYVLSTFILAGFYDFLACQKTRLLIMQKVCPNSHRVDQGLEYGTLFNFIRKTINKILP